MKEVFVDLERCLGCRNCEVYCALEHSMSKNLFTAIFEKPLPIRRVSVESSGTTSIPIQCRHCEEAPCVDTCPSGAMRRDLVTGIVLLNQDRCIGCWMCAVVCPFGAITPERETRLVLKCDRCPDLETPACVTACHCNALLFGELKDIMKKKRKRVATLIMSAASREIKMGGIL